LTEELKMISWKNILAFASAGNPTPDHRINKTDEQWRSQLSEEQFRVARQHGTEPAFSSDSCSLFEPGIYACVCCETLLFNAEDKYESGTGWPSFSQPIKENAVSYYGDSNHGMQRIEARCNTCDAHLGHVFPDGPEPSGLRYCMNAIALKNVESASEKATFGGGCFWCTETIFKQLRGVLSVESGYSGGSVGDPSYQAVCSGTTGHAEVVQVKYNPEEISYEDLLRIQLSTHNPTSLNQQGADKGTQYRSIILTHNSKQQERAAGIVEELQRFFDEPIVTEIQPFEVFYKAEDNHQNYYDRNSNGGYCQSVINPKLANLRKLFEEKLKK
jgi:peptide methionine sulfoxide reductase msrA/msrB